MRKEISPELYNYNKYPGPDFRQHGQLVDSEHLHFEIRENVKDAFDATVFSQRFSEILTKFDYIVGDWGNEQLRLRGFYKDERSVAPENKISRLEDYLLEYCNYGCAYFVLENLEPHRASFDKKSKQKKDAVQEQSQNGKPQRVGKKSQNEESSSSKKRKRSRHRKPRPEQEKERHFVIRQKEEK